MSRRTGNFVLTLIFLAIFVVPANLLLRRLIENPIINVLVTFGVVFVIAVFVVYLVEKLNTKAPQDSDRR